MDNQQRYRLADTINHLTYPQRLFVLELCMIDNRYNRLRVQKHLRTMRERRWPIERTNIQVFQDWLMQLEEAAEELRRISECHLTMMYPEVAPSQPNSWSEGMVPLSIRNFGIIW